MTLSLVIHISVFVMVYSCCRHEEARRKVQQHDIATGHALSVLVMVYSCCRHEEARRKVQQRDIATGHVRQCVRDGVQLLQA